VKKKSFLSTLSAKTLRKRKKDFPTVRDDMSLRSTIFARVAARARAEFLLLLLCLLLLLLACLLAGKNE
jgi:hypothetical protein